MVHHVVVGAGEDFVPGLQWQAVIDQGQTHGRVAGEGDLLGPPSQVGRDVLANPALDVLRFGFEEALLHGQKGVLVDDRAEALEGGPHRLGVGGDEEAREVEVVPGQPELGPDLGPVIQVGWRRCCGLHGGEQAPGEQEGAQGGALGN